MSWMEEAGTCAVLLRGQQGWLAMACPAEAVGSTIKGVHGGDQPAPDGLPE